MSYSLAFSQAIMTVLFVADKVEQGFYDFVPTKELSAALNIPRPTAVKILGNLSSAGLIETREGAKGGVRLAVAADDVTMLDVFNAIETGKPMFRHDFELRVTGEKPTRAQGAVLTILTEAETAMQERLAQTTIANLIVILNE
ncbi:MAG: Rrf2 family transcriptional regulator [Ardenticatenaceae bacterium]|nr:Rrf2 family transcriptional regulator [Anaerolineales bacterium]MCB8923102.1 Rrf2 family transcriptional regulator [Ardenticatenaceae bacterium]MCB8990031.1 Rrf2 family transcriptional regulator [Ardenticatenaceae bacterium]